MRVAALLAVPIALVGLAVPASAEDPGLTITWPAATDVQVPSESPYTFTIADTAPEPQGTLHAEWQGERIEIPHNGDHAMQFTKGGTGTIKVFRCQPAEPAPVCTDTGVASPELTVSKFFTSTAKVLSFSGKSGDSATLEVAAPTVANAVLDVAWTQVPDTGEATHGTSTAQLDDQGVGSFSLPVVGGDGGAIIHLFYEAEVAPFGPHHGGGFVVTGIDGTAPSLSTSLSTTSIYPYRDGYRDALSARFRSNDRGARGWVRLINAKGTVVRSYWADSLFDTRITINGRTAGGSLLPAGAYRLQATVSDAIGNQRVVTSRSFSISHKRLQKRTYTRTFKAAATLTRNGAFVQACSTLRKPSLRPWAGSLGYYSRTKCNRDNADIVSTTNGVYVPKAFQNKYGTYQVSFYGGGARGTRGAYIVMGYLNNKNAFAARIQGGAAVRTYQGKVASAGNFVHDKTTRPYVLWTAGLTDGSRYDVKSFTVKLTYTVLA